MKAFLKSLIRLRFLGQKITSVVVTWDLILYFSMKLNYSLKKKKLIITII